MPNGRAFQQAADLWKARLSAVGHSILVIAYYVLTRREPYRELGGNYFDERARQTVQRRLVQRLERLGYTVTIQSVAPVT